MDIRSILHDGPQTLHRGSVDRGSDRHIHSGAEGTREDDKPPTPAPVKNESGIPRRSQDQYPIWATVWNQGRNKITDDSVDSLPPKLAALLKKGGGASTVTGTSSSFTGQNVAPTVTSRTKSISGKVGPGGGESLTGLAPSLPGYVASDSTAHILASWVFDKLGHVDASDYKNLELEFKFGLIWDTRLQRRATLPVLTEAVIDPKHYNHSGLSFKSEIDTPTFKRLEDTLNALESPDTVTKVQTLQKDEQFRPSQGPSEVRVSTDDRGELVAAISKKRVADLFIYAPQSPTDLRVSLSVESPVTKVDIANWGSPDHVRHKNRLSWETEGCRVDLTAVNTELGGGGTNSTKEAEVEVNMNLLVRFYEEFGRSHEPKSMDEYMEVLRYALDTSRILRRL